MLPLIPLNHKKVTSKNSEFLSVKNEICRLQLYKSCFELSFKKVMEISENGIYHSLSNGMLQIMFKEDEELGP